MKALKLKHISEKNFALFIFPLKESYDNFKRKIDEKTLYDFLTTSCPIIEQLRKLPKGIDKNMKTKVLNKTFLAKNAGFVSI